MKIAIIGSGNVGGALAKKWLNAGHDVMIGAQKPLSKKNLDLAAIIGANRFKSIPEAVEESDAVLIATPPIAVIDIVEQMGDVSGKTLIDATNSVKKMSDSYPTVFHYLAEKTSAELVKCFNSTGFENINDTIYEEKAIDMFMAGESDLAKGIALQLALDAGFGTCIDFGKSDKVELLEKFAISWINLAIMQGHGRNIAFRLVRR